MQRTARNPVPVSMEVHNSLDLQVPAKSIYKSLGNQVLGIHPHNPLDYAFAPPMPLISVRINHGGNKPILLLDTSKPPRDFKERVSQLTGVPVDRMKVLIKGHLGLLKDETWGNLTLKGDMRFTVLGIAAELPKPPEKKIVFLEGSVVDPLSVSQVWQN